MSAAHALEKALGLQIPPPIRNLRRLLYCGEYIESHALHIYFLHAPDFLGFESGLSLAAKHRDVVEKALRLKKIGNQLVDVVGGRAIHPINATVGGFYRAPPRAELLAMLPDLEWSLQAAIDTLRLVAGFDFPNFAPDYEMVCIQHPQEFPMNEGRVVSSKGLNIPVEEYEQHFTERHVKQSNALHSIRWPAKTNYLVGPLARVNLCFDQLSPTAKREAEACNIPWPCRNNFQSIIARAIELIDACEEALGLIRNYQEPSPSRVPFTPKAGVGCHATEAPRGLLYHRYRIGDDGLIAEAKIVPPTAQNLGQIEADLRGFLPSVVGLDDDAATQRCEHLIRNYDPCISCATHFLRLKIDRG
jgi:coenzyme F420-reducing hydrogenase alpha subunit